MTGGIRNGFKKSDASDQQGYPNTQNKDQLRFSIERLVPMPTFAMIINCNARVNDQFSHTAIVCGLRCEASEHTQFVQGLGFSDLDTIIGNYDSENPASSNNPLMLHLADQDGAPTPVFDLTDPDLFRGIPARFHRQVTGEKDYTSNLLLLFNDPRKIFPAPLLHHTRLFHVQYDKDFHPSFAPMPDSITADPDPIRNVPLSQAQRVATELLTLINSKRLSRDHFQLPNTVAITINKKSDTVSNSTNISIALLGHSGQLFFEKLTRTADTDHFYGVLTIQNPADPTMSYRISSTAGFNRFNGMLRGECRNKQAALLFGDSPDILPNNTTLAEILNDPQVQLFSIDYGHQVRLIPFEPRKPLTCLNTRESRPILDALLSAIKEKHAELTTHLGASTPSSNVPAPAIRQ